MIKWRRTTSQIVGDTDVNPNMIQNQKICVYREKTVRSLTNVTIARTHSTTDAGIIGRMRAVNVKLFIHTSVPMSINLKRNRKVVNCNDCFIGVRKNGNRVIKVKDGDNEEKEKMEQVKQAIIKRKKTQKNG